MKTNKNILIAVLIILLNSCVLLKNASAPDAFKQAKKDDPNYVADEGGKEKEAKLEKEWPPINNYEKNTIGNALQSYFRGHCLACTNKSVFDTLDYVPKKFRNIRDDFMLTNKVLTIKASVGNLFFYTFSTEEKTQKFENLTESLLANKQIISPTRVIGLNDFDYSTATFQTAPGYPGFLLKQNCSGYMDAELHSGITPPFSAIKASMKTDLEKKSSILLVDGYFKSPLTSILENRNNESINTYFYLWGIYIKNGNLINNAWYLDVFRGLMANRILQESSNFDIESSLSAAYKNSLIDVNGNFKAGFKINKEFNLQDWETFIYLKDDLDAQLKEFQPFPNPDQIMSVIYNIDKTLSQSKTTITPFSKNIPHNHTVNLLGVPKEYCDQKWSIKMLTNDVYNPGSFYMISSYKLDNGQDICECIFTGTPQVKWFPNDRSTNTVNLEYELVNTEKIGEKELKVKIQRSISTTGEPRFVCINSPERSKISIGGNDLDYYLQWRYNLELQDRNNIILKPTDNSGITVPNIIDLSNSGIGFNLTANIIYNPNDKSRYELIIKTTRPVKDFELGKVVTYEDATFNIDIKAKVLNGGEVGFVINNVVIPLPKMEKPEILKKAD